MTRKKYLRRWRGFTREQVSERMSMIALQRFKSDGEKKAHALMLVEARRKIKESKTIVTV